MVLYCSPNFIRKSIRRRHKTALKNMNRKQVLRLKCVVSWSTLVQQKKDNYCRQWIVLGFVCTAPAIFDQILPNDVFHTLELGLLALFNAA